MHACRRRRSGGGRFVTKPGELNMPTMANHASIIELGNQNRTEG
jgi:hypothetical protein